MTPIDQASHAELEARHKAEMNEFLGRSEELAADVHEKATKIVELTGSTWQNASDFVLQNEATQDTSLDSSEDNQGVLPYFELAGHYLEKQNHGAPNCPDISLNDRKASRTKPQAWSKDIDGQEHWVYNVPAILAEAKFLFPKEIKTFEDLKKRVPEIEVWMEMLASVSGNAEEKAQALNIPMAGFRNAGVGEFRNVGDVACLASSSPKGGEGVRYAILGRGDTDAYRDWSDREHGMSLRFLSDKK